MHDARANRSPGNRRHGRDPEPGQGHRPGRPDRFFGTGKQADLFILDPLQARATPVFDPIASLVYSAGAGSVDTVVVAGRVLLDEGRITAVDERAVLVECQSAAWQLARRVGTIPA